MKARHALEAKRLQDIPNIGPRMAADFHLLGIHAPSDLKGKNALTLYKKINKLYGTRHDPCVLDTYLAAIDFMNGASPQPWYTYTKKRKRDFLTL